MKKYWLILVWFFVYNCQAEDVPRLDFSGIENSLNTYISMRVLTEAYAQLGIGVFARELPAERSLRSSNAGDYDGEVFRIANVHKKFTNLIMVPTAINQLEAVAFTTEVNKDIKLSGWQSLKPYSIGGQIGVKFFEKFTHGMNRYLADSNAQLFRMLDKGRIDIAVAAYVNGLKTIKQLKLNNIKVLQPQLQVFPLHHYLHKKHQALVPRLDEVLQVMQASGRIKEIRDGYIQTFVASDS